MSTDVPAASRDRYPLPVTRCQICHRTVTCRPGTLSQLLAGLYRRLIPNRPASILSLASVMGPLSIIQIFSHAMTVSMVAPALAMMIGLGVGIDCALFIVTSR
jgi:hypothetical protein